MFKVFFGTAPNGTLLATFDTFEEARAFFNTDCQFLVAYVTGPRTTAVNSQVQ